MFGMDVGVALNYSCWDFLFTFGGLAFFLVDIALDAWAVVTFYQEKEYFSLGLLLLFLLGSSALAQVYSWLWYHYDNYETRTKVENCLNPLSLKILHVLQLGVYFRYAGVMEASVRSFISRSRDPEGVVVYLSHDLSMLRLIETFSESAPQLVLMLAIILRRGKPDPMTMLKAVGSASAIACSVTMYHRSLRSFLSDKHQQQIRSSLVYFLWNLLLIAPRLAALSLFASVLPCFVFTHFLCSWMILFFCAWRAKTTFMDSAGGEWLFRATVGLIWYFSWFNVVEGQTRYRSLLYHLYIMFDIVLLCGLWCWQVHREPPYFDITLLHAIITSVIIILLFIFGILVKGLYYTCCHPKHEVKESVSEGSPSGLEVVTFHSDTVDLTEVNGHDEDIQSDSMFRSMPSAPEPAPTQKRENKRMRKLAENFYS
ncbi:XK-related protein 8-like [Centroberyx affinis]|uniref:XK-related protein 8-like n=1 Tax=Centroberyx affinis TaxID=166261 RepID=UPI003A5BDB5A